MNSKFEALNHIKVETDSSENDDHQGNTKQTTNIKTEPEPLETQDSTSCEKPDILNKILPEQQNPNSWCSLNWLCCSCNKTFSGYKILSEHQEENHADTRKESVHYQCIECAEVCNGYPNILNHLRQFHYNNLSLSCDVCDELYSNYEELSKHRLIHLTTGKCEYPAIYQCSRCSMAFSNQEEVDNHIIESHNQQIPQSVQMDEDFQCTICGTMFESGEFLKAHIKTHVNEDEPEIDKGHTGHGVFQLKENEIFQILMADNSDDEDALQLDEESERILTQDDNLGLSLVVIQDYRIEHHEENSSKSSESLIKGPVAEAYSQNELNFTWCTKTYVPNIFRDVDYEFGKIKILEETITDILTPFKIFKLTNNFDVLIQNIITESMRYAHQNGRIFLVEKEEMEAFLGINLVMSYHILPSLRDYWSAEPDMRVPYISNIMTRTRFEEILKNLHFCNNNEIRDKTSSNFDRAYKIRPVINHLNSSFQNALNNTKTQSIDEHVIKFKDHKIMKQYIKNKPIKCGFKMWCRCDSKTGYLFQFDLYTGKKTFGTNHGLGESVVQQLTKNIEGLGCEIYIDHFFNSPMLQYKLIYNNIKACGTVETNQKNLPKNIPPDKIMIRGDIFTASFQGISYVKWMDNRGVHLLSNFLSPIETYMVKRRKTGSVEKIDVKCPKLVKIYNENMGGVDLLSQRKVNYELIRRSKMKYYLRLFFDLFDIGVANAYIIFTKLYDEKSIQGTLLTCLQFKQVLARCLINGFTTRQRAIPTTYIKATHRSQNTSVFIPHQMEKSPFRKRCVNCAKEKKENRTNNTCVTCDVHLCYTNDRNCFAEYHST